MHETLREALLLSPAGGWSEGWGASLGKEYGFAEGTCKTLDACMTGLLNSNYAGAPARPGP